MSGSGEAPADDRLIKATLSGDDRAFTELVSRHKRRVFSIVAKYTRNDADLDDICQDIFIKVYKNLRYFRHDAPLEHWVSKIAVHACYDFLNKRRKLDEVPLQDIEFSLSDAGTGNREGSEAWAFLQPALSRLQPEERMVITLLNLEEKSVREVATLTGWSEAKVKTRAFRARQALKKMLEEDDEKN